MLPEENDGIKLLTTMNRLDDSLDVAGLLGTFEGP